MIVGVPVETYPSERRVALVPSVAADLAKAGLEVVVQQGAGEKAGFSDDSYQKVKARLIPQMYFFVPYPNIISPPL